MLVWAIESSLTSLHSVSGIQSFASSSPKTACLKERSRPVKFPSLTAGIFERAGIDLCQRVPPLVHTILRPFRGTNLDILHVSVILSPDGHGGPRRRGNLANGGKMAQLWIYSPDVTRRHRHGYRPAQTARARDLPPAGTGLIVLEYIDQRKPQAAGGVRPRTSQGANPGADG